MQIKLLYSKGDHKRPLAKGTQICEAHYQGKGTSRKA